MPLLLEWENSRRHKGLFRLGRKDGFKLALRQMQEHAADFFKLNGAVITGGILGAAGDGVGQAVVRKVAVRNKVAQNIVLFVLGETVGLAQRLDALFHMPGDGAGIGGLIRLTSSCKLSRLTIWRTASRVAKAKARASACCASCERANNEPLPCLPPTWRVVKEPRERGKIMPLVQARV